jgi:hypothetical protein
MPSAADVETCEACGADIIWTITAAGARMPVDAAPNITGNQAVRTDVAGTLRSRALAADRPTLEGGEWQAMPHFATCTRPRPRPRLRAAPRPVRRRPPWRTT